GGAHAGDPLPPRDRKGATRFARSAPRPDGTTDPKPRRLPGRVSREPRAARGEPSQGDGARSAIARGRSVPGRLPRPFENSGGRDVAASGPGESVPDPLD